MSDLLIRAKTATILLLIFGFLLYYLPNYYLFGLALIVYFLAQYEIFRAFSTNLIYLPMAFLLFAPFQMLNIIFANCILIFVCTALIFEYQNHAKIKLSNWQMLIINQYLLYSALVASVLLVSEFSLKTVLVIWFSVALVDAAGYFFGRQFGRNGLLDKVSPKKTWEGFFGAAITLIILLSVYFQSLSLSVFGFAVVIILSAVFGDFWFSLCKRILKIKDYSDLLPGHGGVVDRIDGLIFALPIALVFCKIFAKHLFVS